MFQVLSGGIIYIGIPASSTGDHAKAYAALTGICSCTCVQILYYRCRPALTTALSEMLVLLYLATHTSWKASVHPNPDAGIQDRGGAPHLCLIMRACKRRMYERQLVNARQLGVGQHLRATSS